jgi:hypothetical protein
MIVVYDRSFTVLAFVITIVNYDPKSFIVQATHWRIPTQRPLSRAKKIAHPVIREAPIFSPPFKYFFAKMRVWGDIHKSFYDHS